MVLNPFSRRDFMKLAAAGAATSILSGCISMGRNGRYEDVPVATQLYAVRNQLDEDVAPIIEGLARMGYQGVEFADYHGLTATQWRKLLDDNGLKPAGTHIYLAELLGDELQETVEFNQEVGNEYLVIRWLQEEERVTRDSLMHTIDLMNQAVENVKPYGMKVGYHNHPYSFEMVDGRRMWDIVADNTSKDFFLQIDTHATADGMNVVEMIETHPGRILTMHVKPFSSTNPDAYLGDANDEQDWPEIFEAAEEVGGIEWYIVEYERRTFPPMEAQKANLDNFNRMRTA